VGVDNSGQISRRHWTDPSRDNVYQFENWALHRSTWRHFRHLVALPISATAQRLIFPDLVAIGLFSAGISYLNMEVLASPISLPYVPFILTSSALGLLLVFRVNASYTRYDLARQFIGQMMNSSRALIRTSMTKVHPVHPYLCRRLIRLTRVFPRVLIFYLTADGDQNTTLGQGEKELTKEEVETRLSDILR